MGRARRLWVGCGIALLAVLLAVLPVGARRVAQEPAPAEVGVDQFHVIVAPAGDVVQVTEVYLLGNSGDATYVGGDGITVVFPLPEGATALSYEGSDGDAGPYREVEGGLADTRAIAPGTATVEARFSYELPFAEGVPIVHAMPLPVQSGVLLLSGTAWKLTGRDVEAGAFTDLGVMDFGGELARAYMIGALASGDALTLEIVEEEASPSDLVPPSQGMAMPGGTEPEPQVREANPSVELGLGIVAVAAAVVMSYGMWRGSLFAAPAGAPPNAALDDLYALADLDARFDAGEIEAPEYHRLRAQLKAWVRARLHD